MPSPRTGGWQRHSPSGPGASAQTGARAAAEAAGPYRWLARTTGAPPSIAAENRLRGTGAWRLPGPASLIGGAAHGPVEGYVAEQAIAPGQIQSVYVNAPGAHEVTLRVYRMGWYGGAGGRLVLQSSPCPRPCSRPARTAPTPA